MQCKINVFFFFKLFIYITHYLVNEIVLSSIFIKLSRFHLDIKINFIMLPYTFFIILTITTITFESRKYPDTFDSIHLKSVYRV